MGKWSNLNLTWSYVSIGLVQPPTRFQGNKKTLQSLQSCWSTIWLVNRRGISGILKDHEIFQKMPGNLRLMYQVYCNYRGISWAREFWFKLIGQQLLVVSGPVVQDSRIPLSNNPFHKGKECKPPTQTTNVPLVELVLFLVSNFCLFG